MSCSCTDDCYNDSGERISVSNDAGGGIYFYGVSITSTNPAPGSDVRILGCSVGYLLP